MKPQRISYPKIVNSMFKNTNMPERTITIENKNGKDIIHSEFIGYHATRETPINFFNHILSDFGSLIDKLTKK